MFSKTILVTRLLLLITVFCPFLHAQTNDGTVKTVTSLQSAENECVKVWVFFNSKNKGSSAVRLSKKSMLRRSMAHFATDNNDAPVNELYVNEIVNMGAVAENIYKWGNAASFSLKKSMLPAISQLNFVKSIRPVGTYSIKKISDNVLEKKAQSTLTIFQHRKMQLYILNVLQAHYYLNKKSPGRMPGEGVLIGFFDSGFRLDHPCFNQLKSSGRVKAQHDFVDGDNDPQDSDSSLNHGSTVLAQVAGYAPGVFTGSAWGVDVALARTEISEKEIHTEEDNWVAALVWAESLGVDIVSSSVGYATDFEDSVLIGNEYISDYPYSSLDGYSTIISHAAALAVKRGMIIVNSIGNEGNTVGTINAPADVDGVIAVGAVNNKRYLSSFSSIGPTWDGRIKPDCVAPGEGIVVPVFNPPGSYSTGFTGTSYSTPLVSGILAMIIQSSKEKLTATGVANKLLNNCHFSPGQDTIDNRYGHGIPDALLSVMDNNDIMIYVSDSSFTPVAGAAVRTTDNFLAGVTDSSGILLLNNLPVNTFLYIGSSRDSNHFTIERQPYYKHVVLNTVSCLDIKVVDSDGLPIPDCGVMVTTVHDTTKWKLITDVRGGCRFVYGQTGDIDVSVSGSGYYKPPVTRMMLTGDGDSVVITLTKIPENSLVLFPTLVRKSDEWVTLLFSGAVETSGKDIVASIYSVSGKLIWTERKKSQIDEPVIFKWDYKKAGCLTPGAYYATVKFDKKLYKKKMVIAG